MQILILAGGRGTRLHPLTAGCPKPLLQLGDRPILTHLVDQIPSELPVTVIVAPSLEAPFRRWRQDLLAPQRPRLYVEPSSEAGPLGPVRALSACVDELAIQDDVLVLMGDSLLPFRVKEFFAGANGAALRIAAYELPDPSLASRFGVIEISPDGLVERFEEKPAQPQSPWIFTGCLYLPQRLLAALPRGPQRGASNAGDLIAEFVRRGERIEVFRSAGDWHDIGTLESYLQAHRSLLPAGRRQFLAEQGNRLQGAVYVHPSAEVAGSTLHDCVVLAGARVVNAQLSSCVVQPHAAIVGRSLHRTLISAAHELPFAGD